MTDRTSRINITCSPHQKKRIKQLALDHGVSITDFILESILIYEVDNYLHSEEDEDECDG